MTASTWPVPAPAQPLSRTNLVGRIVAVAILAFGALVLLAGALGVSVANDVIARGAVVADTKDVASLRAVAPLLPMIGVFGLAHLVAAVGTTLGVRWSMQLGLGLGAVDAVAGILVMFATALSEKPALDGESIGVTILVLGATLFAAARAAEYDPAHDRESVGEAA
jgi:hypothetical protein